MTMLISTTGLYIESLTYAFVIQNHKYPILTIKANSPVEFFMNLKMKSQTRFALPFKCEVRWATFADYMLKVYSRNTFAGLFDVTHELTLKGCPQIFFMREDFLIDERTTATNYKELMKNFSVAHYRSLRCETSPWIEICKRHYQLTYYCFFHTCP